MRERYRSKPEIPMPLRVSLEVAGDPERMSGWIVRLSLVGVDIETLHAPPVGSRVLFYAALDPHSDEVLAFPGRVQWVVAARVGIQFAELGAKETHAIMQAMRT